MSALRSSNGTAVRIANAGIALFLLHDHVVAVEDDCVQCGNPLAGNRPTGNLVTCGSCGWTYDLATCSLVGMPTLQLCSFPVRIVDDRVLIEWPADPT
jgi:nitrite reductase/ring-hydroxylating ferredoxin subunit